MHFLRKGDISWGWAFGVRTGAYGARKLGDRAGEQRYDETLGLL